MTRAFDFGGKNMLGAMIYRLRAREQGSLPVYNGRFMHAVAFKLLQQANARLAEQIHDGMQWKPFTSSMLTPAGRCRKQNGKWQLPAGAEVLWRLTALQDDVLDIFLRRIEPGREIYVGKLPFELAEVSADPARYPGTGVCRGEELLAASLSAEKIDEITLDFCSPTTFHSFGDDMPWPQPNLVFGSLAEKFLQAGMPARLDIQMLKQYAANLLPIAWSGHTEVVAFDNTRIYRSFTGRFTYALSGLPPEARQTLLLLAQFAEFSGAGRMTGQGMGQVRMSYR